MSDYIFKLALEQIRLAQVKLVMLSPNVGEPLATPHFIEKLKRLRSAGIEHITVTTNAVLLHKVGVGNMLSDGPDVINISFAGFDKEMYERDYRIGHYERTRDNILDLLRKNAALDKPRIINFRLRGDLPVQEMLSAPEMKEVRSLANDVEVMTEVDNWLGLITREALPAGYTIQSDIPKITRRPCNQLFDLTVHPDGNIHLCSCRNVYGDPDLEIGNINQMSLAEAHKKIPVILGKWEAGNVPTTCRTCSMYCDPAQGLLGRWRELKKWTRGGSGSPSVGAEESRPAKNVERQRRETVPIHKAPQG